MQESEHIWYKIVDVDKKGNYKVLFHGINRSKYINRGEWLKAEIKEVYDGDPKKSKKYISGWHIIKGYGNALLYLKRFKKGGNKKIIPVQIKEKPRKKEHSPTETYLVEYIKIDK